MPTWPASLPQSPLRDQYQEAPESQVLRSEMSVGPAKTRRRSTASTRSIPFNCHLQPGEIATFEAFFENDIAGGALPFDIPHPRTGVTVSVLIVGDPPYTLVPRGTNEHIWRLAMTLEIQP